MIAEGVETEDQRNYLAGIGCHPFQGFLMSAPVPLDQFQLLLPGRQVNFAKFPEEQPDVSLFAIAQDKSEVFSIFPIRLIIGFIKGLQPRAPKVNSYTS